MEAPPDHDVMPAQQPSRRYSTPDSPYLSPSVAPGNPSADDLPQQVFDLRPTYPSRIGQQIRQPGSHGRQCTILAGIGLGPIASLRHCRRPPREPPTNPPHVRGVRSVVFEKPRRFQPITHRRPHPGLLFGEGFRIGGMPFGDLGLSLRDGLLPSPTSDAGRLRQGTGESPTQETRNRAHGMREKLQHRPRIHGFPNQPKHHTEQLRHGPGRGPGMQAHHRQPLGAERLLQNRGVIPGHDRHASPFPDRGRDGLGQASRQTNLRERLPELKGTVALEPRRFGCRDRPRRAKALQVAGSERRRCRARIAGDATPKGRAQGKQHVPQSLREEGSRLVDPDVPQTWRGTQQLVLHPSEPLTPTGR